MGSGLRGTTESAFLLWTGELAANPGDHAPVARFERVFARYGVEIEIFAGGHRVRLMREHQSIFEAFGLETMEFKGLEVCLTCATAPVARARSAPEADSLYSSDVGASAEFDYFRRFRHVPVQYTCSVQVERLQTHLYREFAEDLHETLRGPDAFAHRWEDEFDSSSAGQSGRGPSVSGFELTQTESELCFVSCHAQFRTRLIARTQSTFYLL